MEWLDHLCWNSFLHCSWGSSPEHPMYNTGYFVPCFLWKGNSWKRRNSWLKNQSDSQGWAYKAQKKRLLFADQQILYFIAAPCCIQTGIIHRHFPIPISIGLCSASLQQRAKRSVYYIIHYFYRTYIPSVTVILFLWMDKSTVFIT